MAAWEPDLSKVGGLVVGFAPHGWVEGGPPFVEGDGVEGVLDVGVDV